MVCYIKGFLPVYEKADHLAKFGNGFFERNILSRGAHLALAPVGVAAGLTDLAIGTICGVGAFLTLGKHVDVYKMGQASLIISGMAILTTPYSIFLKTLFPHNKCKGVLIFSDREIQRCVKTSLSFFVFTKVEKTAERMQFSREAGVTGNIIRHLGSRLTYLAGIVAVVFVRMLETIAGLPFIPVSLLCLGKWKFANQMAGRSLQTPVIVGLVFTLAIKTINPWAGKN